MALVEADEGRHGALGDIRLREAVIVVAAEQVHQGAAVLNPIAGEGSALIIFLLFRDVYYVLGHCVLVQF